MNTLKDFVNWKLTHADKTAEVSGYPLVMENCKVNKKMKQLKIYGNSVQDGTPTPDEPIEVQSVGEPTVNLFDISKFNATTQTINGITFTPLGDERIHIKGKLEDTTKAANYIAGYKTKTFIKPDVYKAKPCRYSNKGVTIQFNISNGSASINISANNTSNNVTFDNAYINFAQIYISGTTIEFDDVIELQLTTNTEDLPYEPYGKYKIPVVQRGINIADLNSLKSSACVDNGDGIFTLTKTSSNRNTGTIYINIPAGSVIRGSCNFEYNGTYYTSSNVRWSWLIRYADNTNAYLRLTPNNAMAQISVDKEVLWIRGYIENNDVVGAYYKFKDLMITVDTEYEGYEPYVEPVTTNIFLNEPLSEDDYIDFKNKKAVHYSDEVTSDETIDVELPKLTAKTTIIEVDTTVLPSNIQGKYIKK